MIDLHIHSSLSDGTDTIEELILLAEKRKVTEFSLTDHDTVMGVDNIISLSKTNEINIIPGIELSSVSNGHIIHILGYMIDYKNTQLKDFIKITNEYSKKYSLDMITKLNKNSLINYKAEKVEQFASFKEAIYLSDLIKAMIQDGYSLSLKEWPKFFNSTFGKLTLNYAKNFPYKPAEAVEIIKLCNGISSFAHAARIGKDDLLEVEKVIPYGLSGLEVYYPYHDEKIVKRYLEFCSKHSLIATGGTDWHGAFTDWDAELGQYGIKDSKLLYEYADAK